MINQFSTSVLENLDSFSNPHKIIAGDLNLCFDVEMNKRGTLYNNTKALEILKIHMEENFMVDIWRMKNPEDFAFTWKRKAPSLVMPRLDYFIVTSGTVDWIDNVYIKPGIKSDHSLIGLEIDPESV